LSQLVRVEINRITDSLIPSLKSRKAIAGAYLFGSVLDQCRPDSDIDVGILLVPGIAYAEAENILEKLYLELPPVHKHPYDIIILNHCSAIFAYRVITQGRLIYAQDMEPVTDFMENISRQRAENYPRYRRALELIAKG